MSSFGGFLLVTRPLCDALETVHALDLVVESSTDQPSPVSAVEVLEVELGG